MGKDVGIQPQQFKKVRVGSHWSDSSCGANILGFCPCYLSNGGKMLPSDGYQVLYTNQLCLLAVSTNDCCTEVDTHGAFFHSFLLGQLPIPQY